MKRDEIVEQLQSWQEATQKDYGLVYDFLIAADAAECPMPDGADGANLVWHGARHNESNPEMVILLTSFRGVCKVFLFEPGQGEPDSHAPDFQWTAERKWTMGYAAALLTAIKNHLLKWADRISIARPPAEKLN